MIACCALLNIVTLFNFLVFILIVIFLFFFPLLSSFTLVLPFFSLSDCYFGWNRELVAVFTSIHCAWPLLDCWIASLLYSHALELFNPVHVLYFQAV